MQAPQDAPKDDAGRLADSLAKAGRLATWLHQKVDGLEIPRARSQHVAAVCHGVAIEHHQVILILLSCKPSQSASALTLVRPLFEAYVRGMWLSHCASEEQLLSFLSGGHVPKLNKLVTEVDALAVKCQQVLA